MEITVKMDRFHIRETVYTWKSILVVSKTFVEERCGLCLIVTSAIVRIMPFAKMRYLYWLQIHIFRGNHGTKHTTPARVGEMGCT